jgi:hypothetical protein
MLKAFGIRAIQIGIELTKLLIGDEPGATFFGILLDMPARI